MRIYLAGFDVFRENAVMHGEYLKTLCANYGFEGVFPLDNQAPKGMTGQSLAVWIFRQNVHLIKSCDIIMANLNDFRGDGEPDSGTCWEIGFAHALNIDIYGYQEDMCPMKDRIFLNSDNPDYCVRGYAIEDFGLPVNLMIACTAHMVDGGPEDCLKVIKEVYDV